VKREASGQRVADEACFDSTGSSALSSATSFVLFDPCALRTIFQTIPPTQLF
jgi:hypothetical protein